MDHRARSNRSQQRQLQLNTGWRFPARQNGNSGTNEGIYVYTLAFTITGTGSGTVTNAVSIGVTISADDQFAIYVNPAGNGTSLPTGTAAATTAQARGTTRAPPRCKTARTAPARPAIRRFVIGTNYLVVVVDNTNSATGSSSSTATNASGLLVYKVGSAVTRWSTAIPFPEEGTWLPVAGAAVCPDSTACLPAAAAGKIW